MIVAAIQAAHAQWQRGDVAGADRALRSLIAAHPRQPDVLHLHALVLRAGGDLTGAVARMTAAIALAPTAERWNTLGNMRESAGDAAGAEAAFRSALALDAGYAPATINLAVAEAAAGRADDGIARLRALRDPGVLAQVTLARLLRERGDHAEALAAAERAVALQPATASSHAHHGITLAAAGRPREALAAYDRAEAGGYAQPQLIENRLAALLDLDEVARARDQADALVTRFPAYLPGHRTRARLYWEYGLEGDPVAALHDLARASRGDPAPWAALVALRMDFKRYREARETIAEARRAGAGAAPLAFADATAASELGDEDADEAFVALEAMRGDDPAFLGTAARHWLRRGAPARAAAMAERATRIAPADQLAWAYLGTAWRVLGDARADWLHDYDRQVTIVAALPPADVARAAAALRRLHRTRVHPADQSLRGGTQTAGELFAVPDPDVRLIRDAAMAAATAFADGLPADADHPFYARASRSLQFAGSWSVRLTRQGFHINHVHRAGWLSSAFYFALPDAGPDDPPTAGHLQLGAPPEDLGLDLPPLRIIAPRPGSLALFPSSMWHGTIPFATDGERLTAAFDIVPR